MEFFFFHNLSLANMSSGLASPNFCYFMRVSIKFVSFKYPFSKAEPYQLFRSDGHKIVGPTAGRTPFSLVDVLKLTASVV
jgi:hypothetical protein